LRRELIDAQHRLSAVLVRQVEDANGEFNGIQHRLNELLSGRDNGAPINTGFAELLDIAREMDAETVRLRSQSIDGQAEPALRALFAEINKHQAACADFAGQVAEAVDSRYRDLFARMKEQHTQACAAISKFNSSMQQLIADCDNLQQYTDQRRAEITAAVEQIWRMKIPAEVSLVSIEQICFNDIWQAITDLVSKVQGVEIRQVQALGVKQAGQNWSEFFADNLFLLEGALAVQSQCVKMQSSISRSFQKAKQGGSASAVLGNLRSQVDQHVASFYEEETAVMEQLAQTQREQAAGAAFAPAAPLIPDPPPGPAVAVLRPSGRPVGSSPPRDVAPMPALVGGRPGLLVEHQVPELYREFLQNWAKQVEIILSNFSPTDVVQRYALLFYLTQFFEMLKFWDGATNCCRTVRNALVACCANPIDMGSDCRALLGKSSESIVFVLSGSANSGNC